jgi:hypothetical protein
VKRSIAIDCALLCLLTAVLIWPLFRVRYFDDWKSPDGAIVTSARYIQEHFPHPKWQALWYGGARFDYLNPPAAGFGSALLAMLLRVPPAQAYHIFLAVFYCAGIAGVYFLVRVWTSRRGTAQRRGTAWLAAASYAFFSPVFAIFPAYREDSAHAMPLRLNYLIKWGDGPHIAALAITPFALAFLYLALKRRSMPMLSLCAAACAFVVSASLYAGIALAILSAIVACSVALEERNRVLLRYCALLAALTFGLCAWWLTPSFIKLVASNLNLVTSPGNTWSRWLGATIAVAILIVTWKYAAKMPRRAWPIFLGGATLIFGLIVVANKLVGFRIAGEPMRFLPELDLLLVLVLAEGVHFLWTIRRRFAIGAVILAFCLLPEYPLKPWSVFPVEHNLDNRVERRLTDWIAQNLPGSRTFATGSLRFWFGAWRDLAELPGGADQGMPSVLPALAQWQITVGDDVERDVAWLVATGTDAVVTHDAASQEPLQAFRKPHKFDGNLPIVYRRAGDTIYRVPRRFPGLARVVDEARMQSLGPIPWSNTNGEQLRAYAAATEDSPVAVDYRRLSNTEMQLSVHTAPGESILIQETWDPGWHAYEGARTLAIRKDVLNFMRIQTAPGDHDIRLNYEWPLESRIGHTITLLSIAVLVCFGVKRRFRRTKMDD